MIFFIVANTQQKSNILETSSILRLIKQPGSGMTFYFVTEHPAGTVSYYFSFTSIQVVSHNLVSFAFQPSDLGYYSYKL